MSDELSLSAPQPIICDRFEQEPMPPAPPLPPFTIDRLRAVKEKILAEPQTYNQYVCHGERPSCGSPCCLVGWAHHLFVGGVYQPNWWSEVGHALGLEEHQLNLLYFPGQWPADLRQRMEVEHAKALRWGTIGTPAEAAICAERIERFIATGGEE